MAKQFKYADPRDPRSQLSIARRLRIVPEPAPEPAPDPEAIARASRMRPIWPRISAPVDPIATHERAALASFLRRDFADITDLRGLARAVRTTN